MSTFGFGAAPNNMFGGQQQATSFGGGVFGQNTMLQQSHNPMKNAEVVSPPEDSVSSMAFSPPSVAQNFLIAGSWDNQIRCWEVQQGTNGWQSFPKAQQTHNGPVLDVAWSDVCALDTRHPVVML